MTINSRIKELRKNKGMNQKAFASALGVTQSGVSYMEQEGSNVSEQTIKAICLTFNVNEAWLRYGTAPMYIETDGFNIDEYLKSKKATDSEIELIKAFLDLDPHVREAIINLFKERLSPRPASNIKAFRAARSEDNSSPEIVDMPESELEALRNAPTVTSDEDL